MDEAAAAYEEAIRRDEARGDKRGVAVDKGQLGTLRMLQQRYGEALEIFNEARRIFESLADPITVAVAWHQIGMVHREAGQFEQAEQAYRQSLAIKVQQANLAGEASTLSELGTLYGSWGRFEESVKCFRQAADIYVRLQAQSREGFVRHNLANTLIMMEQYDEARRELLRAVECNEPYGHAAQPWTTWATLYELERANGNPEAATRARQKAVESYLAYRRAGGQSMNPGAQLCAMAAQEIEQKGTTELKQNPMQLSREDAPSWAQALTPKLRAILRGERNPALADDPNLDYDDAVELQLLLEELGTT